MNQTSVSWGAIHWMIPVALVGLAFMALIVWSYGQAATTRGVRWLAGLLKAVAVALLLLCLLEPLLSGVRPRPGANLFTILVDNSRSMRISGRGVPAAGELPAWFGREEGGWRARLAQEFDVRSYAFDRDVRQADSLEELDFDGDASNLSTALATLKKRFRNRPLAGVLLLTDGNATDSSAVASELSELDCPVFPVWSQLESPAADIRLEQVRVSQTHFETSPTTISADLVATGLVGQSLVAQLVDEKGNQIDEQIVKAGADGESIPVTFRFRPTESGISFHRLQVFAAADRAPYLAGKATAEATTENNERTLLVKRGGGPFRILYVAGRPNWEFKFLRRALQEDDEIQLVGLLRIANKEPKFQFQDQSGTGDTNRLFKGFEGSDEPGGETYDEPVFVRIVVDQQELAEGFPSNDDTLFAYDAVIVDDLEAEFFSPDQMLLLRRYVSQRGGGLMMLGGISSFAQGGYARTPLGDMLPIYLNRGETRTPGERTRLRLTREGMLETWTRLRTTEAEEETRLNKMPGFYTLNAVGEIKPGAVTVAEVSDGTTTRPAIVTQRFGKGRTAAICVGDLWRWSLERETSEDTDPDLFWRQVIRWLVAEVPQRLETEIEQGAAGQPARLSVGVKTPEFQPDDNASVELTVESPSGVATELTAEPSETASGTYVADFWPREPGGYRVTAKVVAGDGEAMPGKSAGWVFAPQQEEFERLQVDGQRLAQLAQSSGGELIHPGEIAQFVSQLRRQPVPVTEHWVAPLWHQAWVFSLAIACLCAEWGLRRWKGLT